MVRRVRIADETASQRFIRLALGSLFLHALACHVDASAVASTYSTVPLAAPGIRGSVARRPAGETIARALPKSEPKWETKATSPWLRGIMHLVQAPPVTPRTSSRQRTQNLLHLKDPEYYANVGQAIEQLREDHAQIPGPMAPGLSVALPDVTMELAQVPGHMWQGQVQYARFWGFFRTAVEIFSTEARSEVVSVYQVGSQVRIRWRLVIKQRMLPLRMEGSLRAMQNTFGGLFGNAGENPLFTEMERSGERKVDFNSIYELDVWNGHVVSHTLEFRTPEEDVGLIRALQSSMQLNGNARRAALVQGSMAEEPNSPEAASLSTVELIALIIGSGAMLVAVRLLHRRGAGTSGKQPLLSV